MSVDSGHVKEEEESTFRRGKDAFQTNVLWVVWFALLIKLNLVDICPVILKFSSVRKAHSLKI